MTVAVTLVPQVERVRLRKLTTTDGTVHVGLEVEYRSAAGTPTRLQISLSPERATELGTHLAQLGEKLQVGEH